MLHKPLYLVTDLYGCPNRCRHCWLGHMPNRVMEPGADAWLVDYFRPDFETVVFYSWLREPDFCDSYRARWERDNALSVGGKPERFELASFWRLVRDPDYAGFLKEVGVRQVQLTFFGLEELTDRYTGRKGAFRELLQATEILLQHGIIPRWQAFLNEENKAEVPALLGLIKTLELEKRCRAFGEDFKFFVHAGSCDGENRKLYPIRIEKGHIPEELRPYYLDYDQVLTEAQCCERLRDSTAHEVPRSEDRIVLNIANTFDVYFNFSHMTAGMEDRQPENGPPGGDHPPDRGGGYPRPGAGPRGHAGGAGGTVRRSGIGKGVLSGGLPKLSAQPVHRGPAGINYFHYTTISLQRKAARRNFIPPAKVQVPPPGKHIPRTGFPLRAVSAPGRKGLPGGRASPPPGAGPAAGRSPPSATSPARRAEGGR